MKPPQDTNNEVEASSREIERDLEWLFTEINLLRIEGRYFCFDPKEAARRKHHKYEFIDLLKTPDKIIEKPLIIRPDPEYGYPSTFTYKVLQAIITKLSMYGYPVPQTVSLSRRELSQLTGREGWGGNNGRQLLKALLQLRHTAIWCSFYDKDSQEWIAATFSILNSIMFSGRKGHINTCVLYLDPLIINSFNSRHVFYLNYQRLAQLEPIGQALFKRLFFHFSNIYHKQRSPEFCFKKDYGDICREWLGDLKQERYKAKVIQQLGRHMQALRKIKLIKSFDIEKNQKGDGINLAFYPGTGFFEDYKQFYGKDFQLAMKFEKASDERRIQKPMELVAYFYRQLFKTEDLKNFLPFSEKELDYASSLLEHHSFDDVKELIDFALQEAPKTKFEIKNLGGIRVYLPSWFAARDECAKRIEADHQRQAELQEEHLKRQYEAFRRGELARIRKEASARELGRFEEEARADLTAGDPKPIALEARVKAKTDEALAKQFKIPSFEEWKLTRE